MVKKRFLTKRQPSGTNCPRISRQQHQPHILKSKLRKYIKILNMKTNVYPNSDKFLPKTCSILSPHRIEPKNKSNTYKTFPVIIALLLLLQLCL